MSMDTSARVRCTLYVPASAGTSVPRVIRPGSAIVADWQAHRASTVLCYHVHARCASNILTYADRVFHAASRLVDRYPTTAQLCVSPRELTPVGWLDYRSGRIRITLPGRRHLAHWLNVPAIPDTEWVYFDDIVYAKLAALKANRDASVDPGARQIADEHYRNEVAAWDSIITHQLHHGAHRPLEERWDPYNK